MDYKKKYFKYKEKYLNLKNQLGGYIGKRANYECEIYQYCNEQLNELLLSRPNLKEDILKMFVKLILTFMEKFKELNCLNEFIEFYNKKTDNVVLTGAIKIDHFFNKLEELKLNKKDDLIKNHLNIRISLTFLDIIFKFILSKKIAGAEYIDKVSKFFDDNVRHRISTDPVSIKNEGDYVPRDELRINDFKGPLGVIIRGDEHCRLENGNKLKCCNMVELIEPYLDLEKEKYNADKLNKDFNVGSNLFSDSTPFVGEGDVDTIDVFGAGLSGHTTDIILLFTIFTQLDEHLKYYLVIGCLIWMLNFYHHSLREIVLVGTIFMKETKLTEAVLELFKKKTDNINDSKEKINIIFNILREKIDKNNNMNIQIRTDIIELLFKQNKSEEIRSVLNERIIKTENLKAFVEKLSKDAQLSLDFPRV